MARRLYALLLVLFILIPTTNIVVKATGTGYLAIKDYLGRTWTMQDVEKIINYRFTTQSGELKSLADYFWIVVDDDPDNKYNLRNFTASPLDGKTAVLALPAGDHYVDIYWFGYHQRQLVHIVENQHYVLNLETAPVVPFRTAGEPPSSAEWDLAYSPDGLKIQRRDGNAYVLFKYNTSYIEVAWYDSNTGWNYQELDIYIDTNYQYKFHVKDPSNPEYYEEKTGSFLWIANWDVYKIKEEVRWNRTGEILHVVYTVAIAENTELLKAALELYVGAAQSLVSDAMGSFIDPVTYTVMKLRAFTYYVQGAYDNFIATVFPSKYQNTVLLIWDVFVTPTQIIVLAHAYDVKNDGTVVKKPITSANAFTIDNRLVYVKQLSGGLELRWIDLASHLVSANSGSSYTVYAYVDPYYTIKVLDNSGTSTDYIYLPGGDYYTIYVDDLAKYNVELWFSMKHRYTQLSTAIKVSISLKIMLTFDNTSKADVFEQRLSENNIQYNRNGNTFTFTYSITGGEINAPPSYKTVSFIYNDDNIRKLIPRDSSGKISFEFDGYVKMQGYNYADKYYITNIKIMLFVNPALAPPQISLLRDGYQTVNGAFAVQVFTDMYKEDQDAYVLGYYLLGNEPPPSYIIRDVYYDVDSDVMHYVFTVITADAYGQDIVNMNSTYNDTTKEHDYYLSIKPTVRTYDNVTFALFNYNKMAFLNLAPDIIQYLLAVPPVPGYGTPTVDWANVQTLTVDLTRPYKLYWLNNKTDEWVEVWPDYDSNTVTYYIKRASDNLTIETLPNGTISDYFYKLVYTDTNESYTGYLKNDNGTLKLIAVSVKWSLSPQELQLLLQQIQLHGIYDQWLQQWNKVAKQLGLITEQLNNIASGIAGAWDWLNRNWKWVLIGIAGLFLLMALITRNTSKVVIAGRFR